MKVKWIASVLFSVVFCVSGVLADDSFVRKVPSEDGGQFQRSMPPDSGSSHKNDGVSVNGGGDDPDLNRRWLLAVGIRKFADTRIPALKYTANDARSFAEYFRNDGVPESRIRVLLDDEASRKNILSAIDDIKAGIGGDDSFFFFYSSHGAGDAEGNTYFVAFDTISDELSDTGVPMQGLRDIIKGIACKNVVMLVDTCHSGGTKALAPQDEKAYDQMVRAASKQTRIAILTSSRTHETSVESDQWGHGVFTYYLLEGIGGVADDFPKNGKVSVTELFDYVMVAVPRATNRAQHPSGKFSYNWPTEHELEVAVGRVMRGVKNAQGQGNASPQPDDSPPPVQSGGKWQTAF